MAFSVYIVASERNGTLYIGSTDNLIRRVWEHKTKSHDGFTQLYSVDQLVWFETHQSRDTAFRRERRMKQGSRAWKLKLIEEFNPGWRDLYEELW